MPSPDLEVQIAEESLQGDTRRLPRLLNQAYNRELRLTGGEFGRVFTKSRLVRGGVNIARSSSRLPPRDANAPALPKKMRLAGFKGTVTGLNVIEGKTLRIRTRNPVMIAHELGATIKGGKGWLRIRFARQPRGVSPEERRNTFILRTRSGLPLVATRVGGGESRRLVFLGFLKRQVTILARLGFIAEWVAFTPRTLARLGAATERTLQRLRKTSLEN